MVAYSPTTSSLLSPSSFLRARHFVYSPWLPPTDLTGDVEGGVENYNDLMKRFLEWHEGERIPESLVWEHPNMHGLKVWADGKPLQFEVCPRRTKWSGSY